MARINPTVQRGQAALEAAGYRLPRYGADGIMGRETREALLRYQRDHNLRPTGRFDADTMERLTRASTTTAATSTPPSNLTNASLRDDATVAQVAAGQVQLSRGASGEPVRKVQQALVAAGYELPRYGADGQFGRETETAIRALQRESGLPETGRLDRDTLVALDRAAASRVRYPEYDRMFQDNRLNTTIAIGYDEDGWHIEQRRQIVGELARRNFQPLDVSSLSDERMRELGLDPARDRNGASYFIRTFQVDGRDVTAVVRLIDPNTPNAKQQFANAFANDELVLYAGHARHGSGPDFDDIRSAAGNFVIGPTYDRGHVTYGSNDLRRTQMTDRYQLMLFSACSTRNYVDELRSIPRNKNAGNLDIIGSTDVLYWGEDYTNNVFTVLDGVMARQSINDMQARLEQINGNRIFTDGFRGNQYQPR